MDYSVKLRPPQGSILAPLPLTSVSIKEPISVHPLSLCISVHHASKYLGVTLDGLLTYRRHLESLHKKLTSHAASDRTTVDLRPGYYDLYISSVSILLRR
ncbi:unnamed protein product [Clavelina lepadiformis]|uniref:Uncharacterized protein n=1 Tax=Clavelina lepadiformis TaxID=159417 RepID=A0ABP0G9A1_CLALP